MRDFDDHFNQVRASINDQHRKTARLATAGIVFGLIWIVFLMACIGTGIFLLGRWLAVW